MSQSDSSHPTPSADGPTPADPLAPHGQIRPRGRYRFCGGQPVDPEQGVHPEMRSDAAAALDAQASACGNTEPTPTSPDALIAMQNPANKPRPEKPERQASAHVVQVMELIDKLDTRAADDLDIALRLVRRLESFHDGVVDEMRQDDEASHNQLICWAIDADRLMQARILLGNVDLE